MAMIAMTIPLANSVRANAEETVPIAAQTAPLEKDDAIKSEKIENQTSHPQAVTVVEKEANKFSPLIKVLKSKPVFIDKAAVILPNSKTVPITAKALEATPTQPLTVKSNQENINTLTAAHLSIDRIALVIPKPTIVTITAQAPQAQPTPTPAAESNQENPNPPATAPVPTKAQAPQAQPTPTPAT